ncbi:MAG: ABC transporter permease [Butyrivibrio sp.]|nr:ABC transporter permease [Butyrivibrio sp.]
MFFRILKNDLKRKKIMNTVLLLFVIMSAMFASSSVNNMFSVYGGIDYFCDKAGMSDYVVVALRTGGECPAEKAIDEAPSVKENRREDILFIASKNIKKNGKKYVDFENPGVITSIDDAKLTYFNRNDEEITEVPKGHIYVGGLLADESKTHIGDTVTLEMEGVEQEFVLDGYIKDVLFGSPYMGNPRILMNGSDVEKYLEKEEIRLSYSGSINYIFTDDLKSLKKDLSDIQGALFANERSVFKLTYMLDMITAGLLMIVSICLILISFAMLSFTIKFTLSEDFREIGVMKAVGVKTSAIRGLYLIKYLFISCVGAVIGYFLSIPFGAFLLKSVSERMVLGNDDNTLIGIVSAIAVVVIIVSFCYGCTRSIKKLSPIDAVRNGETGERYQQKSALKLSKSKLPGNLFLALNDVLSKPKQYISMLVTFTVCLLLITMLANTANTLVSERLLFLMGTTYSDVFYASTEKIMDAMGSTDEDVLNKTISDIEDDLKENGMPGKVHVELMYTIPAEFKNEKTQIVMQQCKRTKTTDYVYSEGTAPLYENEVAFTQQILDDLGASIGDKITLEIGGEKKDYLITATFSSFNQLGRVGRLHQDVPLNDTDASSAHAFQIDFDDDPSEEVINERILKLKDVFDTDKIYNKAEYVDISTNSATAVNYAKNLVLIIAVIIAALVSVLMERSFISKETGEIALMKAIGFKSRSVSLQHTLRFVVLMVIATAVSGILTVPFTRLVCDRIFAIMGALSGIEYNVKPLEVFVIYPVILSAAVVVSTFVTSLYAGTVRPEDMGNIE